MQRAAQANVHIHACKQNFGNGTLAHKVRSPGLESFSHTIGIFAVREEYDREVVQSMALSDSEADIKTVHLRHVDVKQNQIHFIVAQISQRVFSRIAAFNAITDAFQKILGLFQDFFIIINNKNFFFYHHILLDQPRTVNLK